MTPLAGIACPRCKGQMLKDYDDDLTCLSCGYVQYPPRPPEPEHKPGKGPRLPVRGKRPGAEARPGGVNQYSGVKQYRVARIGPRWKPLAWTIVR